MFIFNREKFIAVAALLSSVLVACSAAIAAGGPGGFSFQNSAGAAQHSAVPAAEHLPSVDNAQDAAGAANNQHDSTTTNQFTASPPGTDDESDKKQSHSAGSDIEATSEKPKLKFTPKMLVTAPKRMLKAAPGLILGAPIATTRKVIDESRQATIDLAGDNRNPVVLSVLSLLGIPAGILTGGTEGPATAAANGWKYAYTKPFSKEYFSLEEEPKIPEQ